MIRVVVNQRPAIVVLSDKDKRLASQSQRLQRFVASFIIEAD
jgi:hypothetical protein